MYEPGILLLVAQGVYLTMDSPWILLLAALGASFNPGFGTYSGVGRPVCLLFPGFLLSAVMGWVIET